MGKSLPIGTYFGVPVLLHWSWFLMVAFVFLVSQFQGNFLLATFFFVLVHEYFHALAAKLVKWEVGDITLFALGGMARIKLDPSQPYKELFVTAAGPFSNVIFCVIFFTLAPFLGTFPENAGDMLPPQDLFAWVFLFGFINLILLLFNLVPAFPSDGGRIFRSLMTITLKGNYVLATQVAFYVCVVCALLMGVAAWTYSSPMLLILSLFIVHCARHETESTRQLAIHRRFDAKVEELLANAAIPAEQEIHILENIFGGITPEEKERLVQLFGKSEAQVLP